MTPSIDPAPTQKICDVAVVADQSFFREVGLGSVTFTVQQILWLAKEANAMLMSKDFDDDGRSERIGLNVDTIIIHTSERSKVGQKRRGREHHLRKGKYRCMADLLFDWFQFDQTCKFLSNSTYAKQVNPNQCDQIGRFIGLWATFKVCGNN